MDHDRLAFPVPMICEHCFCPILRTGFMHDVAVTNWPGTHRMKVHFHSACFNAAMKIRRKNRHD